MYDHTHTPAATQRHAHAIADRSPMLSLAGVSGAAFVMMSCKAPPPMPLRPAMGKGLLRADTTLVLSLGQSRRPPHSARGASMLAHDGSTSTPTATATALALAMMLAFAPMGDAKAAVGVCDGMSPLRSIGCQRAAEAGVETKVHQEAKQEAKLNLNAKYLLLDATKEAKPEVLREVDALVCQGMLPQRTIDCFEAAEASRQYMRLRSPDPVGSVLRAPTQRAQAAGRRLDPEQEVKALQARVATLEKNQKEASDQTLSNRERKSKELSFYSITFACSIILGYALTGVGIKQPTAAIIQLIVTVVTALIVYAI